MENQSFNYRYPTVLSVAGSDNSGGAGIQADLKTISALGAYGCTAITAITVQNTCGVKKIVPMDAEVVGMQMNAVCNDMKVDAMKTGMLHNASIVREVSSIIKACSLTNFVLDPVMIATSGDTLSKDDLKKTLVEELFPLATIITPNLPEAENLLGHTINNASEMEKAARELLTLGPRAILLKGGHLKGNRTIDILCLSSTETIRYETEKIDTVNLHGTGCTLSAAIATGLAQGKPIEEAVAFAQSYLNRAIYYGGKVRIGKGNGPVNHGWNPITMQLIETTLYHKSDESICQ